VENSQIRDAGQIDPGMTLGAMSLFQSGDFASNVSAMCFEFCELAVLTKKDFMKVVNHVPIWRETLQTISSALDRAADPTKLLEGLGEGDDEMLEEVFCKPIQRTSYKSTWRKVKNMAKVLKGLSPPAGGGFKSVQVQPSRDDTTTSPARTTGFQTLKMSNVERQIMEELSKISSKVRDVDDRVQVTETRSIQQSACLEQLTLCLKRIEGRLDRLDAQTTQDTKGECSVLHIGTAPSETALGA